MIELPQELILRELKPGLPRSAYDLRRATGLGEKQANNALHRLKKLGKIQAAGAVRKDSIGRVRRVMVYTPANAQSPTAAPSAATTRNIPLTHDDPETQKAIDQVLELLDRVRTIHVGALSIEDTVNRVLVTVGDDAQSLSLRQAQVIHKWIGEFITKGSKT